MAITVVWTLDKVITHDKVMFCYVFFLAHGKIMFCRVLYFGTRQSNKFVVYFFTHNKEIKLFSHLISKRQTCGN